MDGLLLLQAGKPSEVLKCGQDGAAVPVCAHDGLSRRLLEKDKNLTSPSPSVGRCGSRALHRAAKHSKLLYPQLYFFPFLLTQCITKLPRLILNSSYSIGRPWTSHPPVSVS